MVNAQSFHSTIYVRMLRGNGGQTYIIQEKKSSASRPHSMSFRDVPVIEMQLTESVFIVFIMKEMKSGLYIGEAYFVCEIQSDI